MSLITEEIEIGISPSSIKHYEELGYTIPKHIDKRGTFRFIRGSKLLVKTKELTNNSHVRVSVKCDECEELLNITWGNYLQCVKEDGKYYCNKCAAKLYGNENMRKIKLDRGISFEQWCLDHNRQDVLDRWSYSLNELKPSEIGFAASGKFWFECPTGIHESELKHISSLTSAGRENALDCNCCLSFAQYMIDLYGSGALIKYWDYESNVVNPWSLRKNSRIKVYLKCQDKDKNHESYLVQCNSFTTMNSRCPRCRESKMEVEISSILDNKNINYTVQKTFKSCSDKKLLRFDFYLDDFNTCVEAQGIQHYEPTDFAGKGIEWAEENFIGVQMKDNIKRDYCKENGIKLLEIKYSDFDKIESILTRTIKQ